MVKYRLILIIYFVSLIKIIDNQCNKDNPILVNGECKNIYCTEEQFQNKECIIANTNIKIQWINKITSLGLESYSSLAPIEMPNKDIIFITYSNYLHQIHLYGLKYLGQPYNNDYFMELSFDYPYGLSAVGLKIDDIQNLLICDKHKCILYDIENKIYYEQNFYKFLKYENDLSVNFVDSISIINIDNNNKILFGYLSDSIDLSIINIRDKSLNSLDGYTINEGNKKNIEQKLYTPSCFITDNQLIECLYIQNLDYVVAIYDISLNYKNSIILDICSYISILPYEKIQTPVKSIHLKGEIGVFSYYIKTKSGFSSPLFLQINELYLNEDSQYAFNSVINHPQSIFNITMKDDNTLGDHQHHNVNNPEFLTKITNNKFSYAYFYQNYEDGIYGS